MKSNKLTFWDLAYKIKKRLFLSVKMIFWRLRIGSIGKGSYLHKGVYIDGNSKRIKIGDNFKIWHRCMLAVSSGKIELGNNGLLGVNSYINASQGTVKIGNNVAIAPFCQIYSYSHHHYANQLIVESYKVGDVTIKDDVLIGSNVIILPGVTIGTGAIVAAGSVVNKNVEEYSIVGGNPIKEIGKRNKT